MLQLLESSLNRLYSLCGYIAAGFLLLLMVLVLASILTRLAGLYIGGLTEYSGYAMAASSYFALAYTFRAGGHIRVTMFLLRMPEGLRRQVERLCLAAATILTAYLAYYMCQLTYYSWLFDERSEGGDAMLMWIPQTGAALGAIVMAISVFHAFIRALSGHEPFEGYATEAGTDE